MLLFVGDSLQTSFNLLTWWVPRIGHIVPGGCSGPKEHSCLSCVPPLGKGGKGLCGNESAKSGETMPATEGNWFGGSLGGIGFGGMNGGMLLWSWNPGPGGVNSDFTDVFIGLKTEANLPATVQRMSDTIQSSCSAYSKQPHSRMTCYVTFVNVLTDNTTVWSPPYTYLTLPWFFLVPLQPAQLRLVGITVSPQYEKSTEHCLEGDLTWR